MINWVELDTVSFLTNQQIFIMRGNCFHYWITSNTMNSNHMFLHDWSQGEKDNWDVIEDDDDKSAGNVVGIGNEEEDEHDIEEYGHVQESGNEEDENDNSDNFAEMISNEIENSNDEKNDDSNNSNGENKGRLFPDVH